MINLILNRKKRIPEQTLGTMDVYKNSVFMFSLATIELGWKNNSINISCIPGGIEYVVKHFNSDKHPDTFILEATEPRTGILIHIVNFSRDLGGCIGVGLTHTDIDNDGLTDVEQSSKAMDKLHDICKNETYILLTIK